MRRNVVVFTTLVIVCVTVGGAYVTRAAMRDDGFTADSPRASAPARGLLASATTGDTPVVVFQHVARDARYAHVALTELSDRRSRTVGPLVCERIYFAAQRGLCLIPKRGVLRTQFVAKIFGAEFEVEGELTLGGINSRARVSADGRYGAVTAFVAGHSYAAAVGEVTDGHGGVVPFSTQTTLIDMANGTAIADVEEFDVFRDGKRIESPDFNFWGVTFARDSNRFYATLSTRGSTYLVEGDVKRRRLDVLRENVECPSLSPDGTRIAYKRRLGKSAAWRLHVLDLRTGVDTPLAEERSIDDQVEWLDDHRVLYGYGADVWMVRSDGRGRPVKFVANALSPAVVRPTA